MSQPQKLEHVIEQGLISVQANADNHLNLGIRWVIYSMFGPKKDKEPNKRNHKGHKRRTLLAILTTEYVLPLWGIDDPILYPKGTMAEVIAEIEGRNWNIIAFKPNSLVQTAKELLAGLRHETQEVWNQYYNGFGFWQDCASVYSEGRDRNSLDVAFSAIYTLGVALNDEIYRTGVNLAHTEYAEMSSDYDVAYYAASAFSSGPPWVPESDPNRRLEFWTWWLTVAVPQAWLAFP